MTMAVVRNGTGPLHIAWVEPEGYDALCGRTLPRSPKVAAWGKSKGMATRIWKTWRHCAKCELEHEIRKGH